MSILDIDIHLGHGGYLRGMSIWTAHIPDGYPISGGYPNPRWIPKSQMDVHISGGYPPKSQMDIPDGFGILGEYLYTLYNFLLSFS